MHQSPEPLAKKKRRKPGYRVGFVAPLQQSATPGSLNTWKFKNLHNYLYINQNPPVKKQKINITLDPDVIAWFKAQAGGRGYQTLINAALREAMNRTTLEATLRQVIREELHLRDTAPNATAPISANKE